MLSPSLIDFIKEHESDDIHELALSAKRYPDIDIQLAVQQISGRKIAKEKVPSWYHIDSILYPKHISMEQCSSEQTARYKAGLVEGNSMIDLTGGFGVDFSFIAAKFKEAIYIEQQEELAEVAKYNLDVLGLKHVRVESTDGIAYLEKLSPVDLIYIDPARRSSEGRKIFRIEDCTLI